MGERIAITETQDIHKEWYEAAKQMTVADLPEFIRHLTEDYRHDYGTICHAMAASAVATCNAVDNSPTGGISGFQAGAVMWEFIRHWMHYEETPMRLLRFDELLYPQYLYKFTTIPQDTADWLKAEAEKLLAERGEGIMHPDVLAHWKMIAAGMVPFGLGIEPKRQ